MFSRGGADEGDNKKKWYQKIDKKNSQSPPH